MTEKQPRPRPGRAPQQEKPFEGFKYLEEKTSAELATFLAFRETPLFKFYIETVEKVYTSLGVAFLQDTQLHEHIHALTNKQGYANGIKFFNGILNDVERELQWRHQRDAAREAASKRTSGKQRPGSVRSGFGLPGGPDARDGALAETP